MFESLHQIDNEILLELNGETSPFWDAFMWTVSAKETWIVMYLSLLFVLWRNFSLRTAFLVLATICLTITFTDQVSASVIRPMVERLRPSQLDNPISGDVYIVNGYRGGRYGFPSCHSANSFGLAFMMILLIRNKLLSITLLSWACLNSYSRIHLGVHYLGDILCGMLVALVGSLLIYSISKRLFHIKALRMATGATSDDIDLINRRKHFDTCMVPIAVMLITLVAIAAYAQITN